MDSLDVQRTSHGTQLVMRKSLRGVAETSGARELPVRGGHIGRPSAGIEVPARTLGLELCLPAESERLATQLARDLAGGSERHGYKVRAFRVGGKTVAGFAAFRNHLSYLPFSGSVLPQLDDELKGYTRTKSALHFPVDRPLAKTLVTKLIGTRLPEIGTK